MSQNKKTFKTAAQFNEHVNREFFKSRALALLSRDPDKRQKYEQKARAMKKILRLFDSSVEQRLFSTGSVVKSGRDDDKAETPKTTN